MKRLILTIKDFVFLCAGVVYYFFKKDTPEWAYQSFVRIFCVTRGYSNDFFSFLISKLHKPFFFKNIKGLLPFQNDKDLSQAVQNLEQWGYVKYPSLVSSEICDQLKKIALEEPAWVRPVDVGTMKFHDKPMYAKYDSSHPIGIRYDFFTEQLIQYPLIQKLVMDPSLLALAQNYLKAPPVLDAVNMWWCTSYSKAASAEAAQMYHFDLERPKWIKIFIYLTDITEETGPHCFVAKSHRSKAIPWKLLRRGYARIEDEEVAQNYRPEDILVMTGSKGTLLAEDTRGLHKGLHLKHGERLIFQIQYSNSMFATSSKKIHLNSKHATPDFVAAMTAYPRAFQRFMVNG